MPNTYHTISLTRYNYDTKAVDPIGEVSVYDLVHSITPEQFAYFFSEYLNSGGKDFQAGKHISTKYFHSYHRTLQGMAVRFCMGFLVGMGEQEYTDGRNEMPVAMCKRIAEMIKDGELKMGWMI